MESKSFSKLKRILVPTDFSPVSVSSIRYAVDIAREQGATIDLFHVIDLIVPSPAYYEPVVLPAYYQEDRRQEVLADLERLAQKEIPDPIRHEAEVALYPHPEAAIIDRANRYHADLIVMGTHGREGFQHFFLGSVAEDVIRHAPCPVMTISPEALESEVNQEVDE